MSEYETVHELVDRVTSVSYAIDKAQAKRAQGNWYPACGGTETEFRSRGGLRLLYVWQPSTGNHGYLNLDTDILLTEDEVRATMQLW
jgi:hypothetical protein